MEGAHDSAARRGVGPQDGVWIVVLATHQQSTLCVWDGEGRARACGGAGHRANHTSDRALRANRPRRLAACPC